MPAVIMAGGKGTRLRPLTCNTPKALIPILGRPVMAYSLDLLARYGFRDVAVTLQHLSDQIRECFGQGDAWGVKLHYFEETVPLGTAGGVKNAASVLKETFVVISGDALTDFDLEAALHFHRQRGALATIILTRVDNPLEYGVVLTKPDGRIERFLEKPNWGEVFSDTVNTGIYLLEPEVLELIPDNHVFDFSRDLFPRILAAKLPFFGFIADGYWSDIGDLLQYRQANLDVLAGRVKVQIPGRQIGDQIWGGETSQISPAARITGPCFIGDNCIIDGGADIGEFTVLGHNNVIEAGASIKRSITREYSYIGSSAELRGATVGCRARIGKRACLFEGTVLADDAVLEPGSVLKAGAQVWPEKTVGQGLVVRRSLVWGDKQGRPLFNHEGVQGTVGTELTPDLLVRLGAAFGSTLSPGVRVAVCTDGHFQSEIARDALTTGLRGTGINVVALGQAPVPVARYSVPALKAAGGIYVQCGEPAGLAVGPPNPGITIQFLDRDGVHIDRHQERRVQNCFTQEDLRWVPGANTGELTGNLPASAGYIAGLRQFLGTVASRPVDRNQLAPVALAGGSSLAGKMLHALLEEQGYRVEVVAAEPGTAEFARTVPDLAAAVGIEVFGAGESLGLVNEAGNRLTREQTLGLLTAALLTRKPGENLVVPANASAIAELVADRLQGNVVRAPISRAAILNAGKAHFHPLFDAFSASLLILDWLVQEKQSLSELVSALPELYYRTRWVNCPWSAKGGVMRQLQEDAEKNRVDCLDGIKVKHNDGWVLVLPDPSGPFVQIYAEANTATGADALLAGYADRIAGLVAAQAALSNRD